jgi:hypothetical protein
MDGWTMQVLMEYMHMVLETWWETRDEGMLNLAADLLEEIQEGTTAEA